MTQKEQWRETLLSVILIVGGLTLTFFFFWDTFNKSWFDVSIDLISGIILWISLYLVKARHHYYWPAIVAWLSVQLILSSSLISGGTEKLGLIWWGLLPIISFILFGSKGGLIGIAIGMLSMFTMSLLSHFGLIKLFFPFNEIAQTEIMVLVISLIMFYYEKFSRQAREEIADKSRLLEEQSVLKKNIEDKLVENLNKLQSEKDSQTNVRTAMLNLLEDSKELEKELQKEKASVEKKVEERTQELQSTKAKLDSSIENMPVGFFMIDTSGSLLVVNALAHINLGAKSDKQAYTTLKSVLNGKIDIDKYIHECNEKTQTYVTRDISLPNGKFLKIFLAPIFSKEISKDKTCRGIVVLVDDITEAMIMERSKDEFFSIASHELRTPLTAIRGNTSMILDYYAKDLKDPELRDMVDDVHESSIRLINIVNDFLNVSRLEQSRMVYDTKQFDLGELIPEILKEYDVTGSRKKLSLEFIPPKKALPKVSADPDKVRQVLINLLGNALKFTEKGGVKISTEVLKNQVKVLVTDTGRGIPLKQQTLLFHKFQQAGVSLFTRDTAGGTGLGLYISRMMIEGMGGQIKLEKSAENKGSVFSFILPLATAKNKE